MLFVKSTARTDEFASMERRPSTRKKNFWKDTMAQSSRYESSASSTRTVPGTSRTLPKRPRPHMFPERTKRHRRHPSGSAGTVFERYYCGTIRIGRKFGRAVQKSPKHSSVSTTALVRNVCCRLRPGDPHADSQMLRCRAGFVQHCTTIPVGDPTGSRREKAHDHDRVV